VKNPTGGKIATLCVKYSVSILLLATSCGMVIGQDDVRLKSLPNGGDFSLTDHNGKRFDLSRNRGKVTLLYFGYTSCTEACPAMLGKVASVFKAIGQKKNRVQVLLVSVDPQRDTQEALKKYLEYFNVGAIGLTGSKEQIDTVVSQYGARYEIEKSTSVLGYHVNHTTDLYMIDQAGKLKHIFKHDDHPSLIVSGISQLLKQDNPKKAKLNKMK
jgi:protein SCO1/2